MLCKKTFPLLLPSLCAVFLAAILAPARAQEAQQSSAAEQSARPASVGEIRSQTDFDALSRVYRDAQYPLPHVLFVIDRRHDDRIYYVDSQRFRFHNEFVNATYLSLDRGEEFYEKNYKRDDRRFIMGIIAYQTPVKRWTFEFQEIDTIPPPLMKLTYDVVSRTFFRPVAYKPNTLRQEETSSRVADLPRVLQTEISAAQVYQPLNVTRGIGRIHIIDRLDETVEIGGNEIVVLNEVPVHLPPVAGIITSQPSTPLSHINLLAKTWGVPNAYIKDAPTLLRQFDGWWVTFETQPGTYEIKRAGNSELQEYQKRQLQQLTVMRPPGDLAVKKIAPLGEQRAESIVAYGGKSANLGEVFRARVPGVIVPPGWTIPFYHYAQFVRENGLEEPIYEMLNDNKFVHNPAYRREKLKEMRGRIQAGRMNAGLRATIANLLRTRHRGQGVFVRSSSNTEDLPNFNGAGIYSSVPNVRTSEALVEAVKTVWASLWNAEAYEARERAGIDHSLSYMAVLVQQGVDADSAGVMITTDPYNSENKNSIYISAKRGLGIRVVEGQKIAEQLIYDPRADSIQVLTRSTEDSLLTFDARGGVRETPIVGERAVLTDQVARRLSRAAAQIKTVFKDRDQDIEWVYRQGQIYIVQSRPYISSPVRTTQPAAVAGSR